MTTDKVLSKSMLKAARAAAEHKYDKSQYIKLSIGTRKSSECKTTKNSKKENLWRSDVDGISLGALNKSFDHIRNLGIWIWGFFKPYRSDKKRYELLMETIKVHSIYHFRHDENNPFFENHIFDGIDKNAIYLNGGIYLPSFKSNKLHKKETRLAKAAKCVLNEINDNIDGMQNGRGYKIQDTSEDKMVKLDEASEELIHAFEDFRDYGSKLFDPKVTRDVVND
ncbi:MAG: hypothetical protein KAJ29_05860 [Alphaproteobacteria bacterium]|nr:hypothetical protein [Alphaproteobacteria bacterium]